MRGLWPLLLGVGANLMGNGHLATVTALRLEALTWSPFVVGVVGACYALGFVVGAFVCPRLVNRLGSVVAAMVLSAMTGIFTLVLLLSDSLLIWAPARLLMGVSEVGIYLAVESWLGVESSEHNRGPVMALYLIACQASLSVGQFTATAFDVSGSVTLLVAATCYFTASPLFAATAKGKPVAIAGPRPSMVAAALRVPIAFTTSLVGGIATGVLLNLGPIYAHESHLSKTEIGIFMASIMIGGALLQLPVGWLSQRMGRQWLIARLALGLALVSLFASASQWLGVPAIIVGGVAMGAAAFALYPVGVAHAHASVRSDEIVPVGGAVLLAFGGGCVVGPLIAGMSMKMAGPTALPVVVAASGLALFGFASLKGQTRVTRVRPATG